MVSIQHAYTGLVDLIFRRVIFLFIMGAVLSCLLIDQNKLKVKTLNTIMPSAGNLKEFAFDPAQMDPEKLKDVLTYYKFVCGYTGPDTLEKPAACGIVGYAYYYLGDEKKAVDYFALSARLSTHSFWTYFDLGIIYYNEGKYQQALDNFDLAKLAYPDTLRFLSATMTYGQMAGLLGISQEGFQQSLDQGAEYLQKLDVIIRLLMANPDLQQQFARKKIDLRLF